MNEPECVFVFPHEPHTLYKRGVAVGTCTGREPMEETAVIPEIDNDPFDALQLAVQLHTERYRYNETEGKLVLADADLFLAWLREKKEGEKEEAVPDHSALESLPKDDDHPTIHRMENSTFKHYRCTCGAWFSEPAEFYEHVEFYKNAPRS